MNEEYINLVDDAFKIFNDQMHTYYSRETVEVKLITAETPDDEIAGFLRRFPEACQEEMFEPGYYKKIKGEALVTPDRYGIVLRTDIEETGLEWRHIVFHEISHVFCSTHELEDGGSFYKRYCEKDSDNRLNDIFMYEGYAIWREFIADFVAVLVDVAMPDPTIRGNSKYIRQELNEIAKGEPLAGLKVKNVLIDTLVTADMLHAPEKAESLKKLERFEKLQTPSWKALLSTVYDQIFNEDGNVWEIDPEFIKTLGANYSSLVMEVAAGILKENFNVDDGQKIMRRMMFGEV